MLSTHPLRCILRATRRRRCFSIGQARRCKLTFRGCGLIKKAARKQHMNRMLDRNTWREDLAYILITHIKTPVTPIQVKHHHHLAEGFSCPACSGAKAAKTLRLTRDAGAARARPDPEPEVEGTKCAKGTSH